MERINDILRRTQFGFLATVERGAPRVRPFHFQFSVGNKFYFCTSSEKKVFEQLQQFPFAAFSTYDKSFNYLKLQGTTHFEEHSSLKQRVLSNNPFYAEMFSTPENPHMVLFSLDVEHAELGRLGQYPPEIIQINPDKF